MFCYFEPVLSRISVIRYQNVYVLNLFFKFFYNVHNKNPRPRWAIKKKQQVRYLNPGQGEESADNVCRLECSWRVCRAGHLATTVATMWQCWKPNTLIARFIVALALLQGKKLSRAQLSSLGSIFIVFFTFNTVYTVYYIGVCGRVWCMYGKEREYVRSDLG